MFSIERGSVSEDARTVNLAFASDKPVDQWFGPLSLSISRKAMRPTRLESGAPLLMDHNPADHVGVVERYSLDRGVARATVRFGESVRAQEVFHDVKTGIRQNVSVGFLVHKIDVVKENGKPDIYRSDDWEPYEISIVSVPADISVGVGRNMKQEKTTMSFETESSELSAAEEITAWGRNFNCPQLATNFLRQCQLGDTPVAPTTAAFFAYMRANEKPQVQLPVEDARSAAWRQGAPREELARSIPRYGTLKAFKGDGAEERAYRFGQFILGGPLGNSAARVWCQQNGVHTRALVEGINEKGGFVVPDEFGNDFVQLLEEYGVFRRNAHIVPMSSDHRNDYVLNGELESQFVGELEEGSDQDLNFGSIGYTVKKHMILVPYSSEVAEDAAISIGDHLAEAAARAFAKKEDLCGFNGDGTSAFAGMVGVTHALKNVDTNIANIQGLQVGSGNAYGELTLNDFAKTVKRLPSYARMNAKWYMTDDFYWGVVVPLLIAGGGGVTMGEIEASRGERLFGKPIEFVEVMPTTEANSQVCALLGDFSKGARLADRRRYTYKVDESVLIRKDGLLFQSTARFTVNCSFGVGDTTKAGPIVGLITAAA